MDRHKLTQHRRLDLPRRLVAGRLACQPLQRRESRQLCPALGFLCRDQPRKPVMSRPSRDPVRRNPIGYCDAVRL